MYGALGMMGMRTGLAPRAGRVSTEAKGRFGCKQNEFSITKLYDFRPNVLRSLEGSAFSSYLSQIWSRKTSC